MHYYPHHIGDFLRDTSHLTNEQVGAYMKLLWKYYLQEKPLENDPEMIAFSVGIDEKTALLLLRSFFVLEADGWHQKRCDQVICEYHGKSTKARESANARWGKAKAMRTHSERIANAPKSDANQEPITKNHIKIKSRASASRFLSCQTGLIRITGMHGTQRPKDERQPYSKKSWPLRS
jgi:uncharacterized protein YdaU (DUF1376 family)